MKFRTIQETYEEPHTLDGRTVMVTRTRERHVPVLPVDADAVAMRVAVGAVLLLTAVSVTWSTVSIAALLGGTWVAYAAAAVFDLSWVTAIVLTYVARYRPDRRVIADRLGWVLLAITVGAIFWEGWLAGSVPLACIGATVSIAAKSLWWAVARTTEPHLSDVDRQWVQAQLSAAGATMAVASVRRQVARIEDRAAAELLALEASRRMPGMVTLGSEVPDAVAVEVPERGTITGHVPAQVPHMSRPVPAAVEAAQEVPQDHGRDLIEVPQDRTTAPVEVPQDDDEVPQDERPGAVEVLSSAGVEDGSPAGTNRDKGSAVPQVRSASAGPVRDNGGTGTTAGTAVPPKSRTASGSSAGTTRHLRPVRGAATSVIRDLIGQGVTDTGTIRTHLQDSGVKVPDDSYIRRLVREAAKSRTASGSSAGTGQYL